MTFPQLPTISIVMPSYNQGRFLEEAIVSVVNQEYRNLEFIIMDGGSQDGSKEIIQRYSRHLRYWKSESDGGQSDALIEGFRRSTGELLGWLNSDDALLPGALHAIGKAALSYPDCGLYGGNYIVVDSDGRVKRCKRLPAQAEWLARRGVFSVGQPGSFFRRRDYGRVGGLKKELHLVMDTDMYMRMLISGTRFRHVNRYVSAFRMHPSSKTTRYADAAVAELRFAQREFWPRLIALRGTQMRWIAAYCALQIFNGNYVRMGLETVRARGKQWSQLAYGNR